MDSSQSPPLNDQRHEGDVVPLVPKESPTAEKLGLAGRRAIRMPDAIHPISASGWLGKDLTFLPGYGQWSRRSMCLLAPPASRTISSRATGRRLAGEYSAASFAFPLRL